MGFIISIVIAYLIGSLSCAILAAKWLKLPDPRTQGSGNAGATNMLRLGNRKAAIIVLIGDGIKGLIAVLIGRLLHVHGAALALVAFVVVVGHVFPLYFKFKGGKGVATAIGAVMGLSFWVAVFLIVTWAVVALIFRYASLASLAASIAIPVYLILAGHVNYFFPGLFIALLIVWRHWDNIERLRQGSESKIQF